MTRARIMLWTALAAAGALGVGIAAGEASGWRFLRAPLREALARAAGVPVQVDGRFHASLLGAPRLEIERLTVGAAGGVSAPHLLDGRGVLLDWHWSDLWRWQRGGVLRLHALQADALDVQLVRVGDGRASWQLGRPDAQPREPEAMPPGGMHALPRVGSLLVSDGHIHVDDQVLDTQLQIAVQGREPNNANGRVSGGYRASITGRYRALPLDLQIQSGSALPLLRDDEDDSDAPTSPLLVKGTLGASHLAFDGRAAALMSARQFEGTVQFGGPSLASVGDALGLTLPQTPAFQLQGRVMHRGGIWSLLAERVTIGRSQLAGDFRVDTRGQPPRLSGRLNGPRLMLADLGPAVGAPTSGSATQPPPTTPKPAAGRVLPQREFDLPSLRAMDADVQLAIDELVFSTDAMTPMHGLRTHLRLNAGVLDLKDLKASVAGGQVTGATRLDTNAQAAKFGARLHFGGVDVAGWISGLRTPTGKAKPAPAQNARALKQERERALASTDEAPPAYLTGRLEADVDASAAARLEPTVR
jgi:uncharacterized protein involved in outer membrane biogenesis